MHFIIHCSTNPLTRVTLAWTRTDSWRLANTSSSPRQGTAVGRQLGGPGCLQPQLPHTAPTPSILGASHVRLFPCHICSGARSVSFQPSQLSFSLVWVRNTEHGAGSGPSPAFPRLCWIKVLLFWIGWVAASPKPWGEGVGSGGAYTSSRSWGLSCAWPRRSQVCGSCRLRVSPHPVPPFWT